MRMTDRRVDEIAAHLIGLENKVAGLSTSARLINSSIEDGSIPEYDRDGNLVARIGKQHDGTHGAVVLNGPVPPTPSKPGAEGGPSTMTVTYDGRYADPEARAPLDLHVIEVYAASQPFAIRTDAALVGAFPDEAGGTITISRPEGTWYVGLVAKSVPGVRSELSELTEVTVEPFAVDETALNEVRNELDQTNIELGNALSRITIVEDGVTSALDSAAGAQLTAESRPRIFLSLNEPGSTQAPQGSIWWQRDPSNNILGQWQQTTYSNSGTNWEKEEIRSEVIANLDVGKLTVGDATIDNLVVEFLWAEVVRSRKITTDMLLVGAGANLLPDPRFEDADTTEGRRARSGATITADGSFDSVGYTYFVASNTITDARAQAIPARAGEQYRFTFSITDGTGTADGSPMGRVERWSTSGVRSLHTVPPANQSYQNGILSYTYEVPADTIYVSPVIYQASPRYVVHRGGAAYRMTDSSLIVDGGITARHITATDLFEGKEFIGGTFTGVTFRTGVLPPRLQMDGDGLSVLHLDPSGEGEEEVGRFGSAYGDFFSAPGVTISDGQGNFGEVHSAGDATVLGRPLVGDFENFELPNEGNAVGWLDRFPRGVIAFGYTDVEGRGILNGEQAIAELSFEAIPGRMYRVTTRPIVVRFTGTGFGAMRLRNGGSSAPTLSSPTLMLSRWRNATTDGTRYASMHVDWVGRCNIDSPNTANGELVAGLNRIMISLQDAAVDTGAGSDQALTYIMVEDLGIDTPSTAVMRYDESISTPPPPPTSPVKTYTRTWAANWMQTYAYNGSSRYAGTASSASQPTQGYTPYWPSGGIHTSKIGFNDSNIRSYLSGATVKKIEVYIRADHWHSASGGVLRIHRHGNSTSPSSYTTSSEPHIVDVSFGRGQGKWITLPKAIGDYFKSGTARGLGFDSRSSTSTTYYGNIYYGGTYTPKIRITYEK